MYPKTLMLFAFLVLLHQTRISSARKLSSHNNKIEIIVEDPIDEDHKAEDDPSSEDVKDILNSDNTEMDNFQFDEQDDVQVDEQEVLSEDLPANVTANNTTDLNDKDVSVPPIPKTTEENDNEPFIVLYINLIRSRRFASLDYEYFGHDDDLYYDGIDDFAYQDSFSNPFQRGLPQNDFHNPFITPREMHHDDFEFADY